MQSILRLPHLLRWIFSSNSFACPDCESGAGEVLPDYLVSGYPAIPTSLDVPGSCVPA